MPDPLQVFCSCDAGGPTEIHCTEQLTLYAIESGGTQESLWDVSGVLDGVPTVVYSGDCNDHQILVIPMNARWSLTENWMTLRGTLRIDRSLNEWCQQDVASISFFILQHYECTNLATGEVTTWEVRSYTPPGEAHFGDGASGPFAACPTLYRSQIIGFAGGLKGTVWHSTSFGGATVALTVGSFAPIPIPYDELDNTASGGDKVCSTGGVPPITYFLIQGTLTGGVTLNPDGTFSGVPDGSPGSQYFTILAVDSTGATSAKICMQNGCQPCTARAADNAFY